MDRARNILILIALAAMVALPFVLLPYVARNQAQPSAPRPPGDARSWVAAAPGRVEPRTGEFRYGSAMLGRITEVLVKPDDLVEAGDVLVRLDDRELAARVAGALAEVNMRKVTRDERGATGNVKGRQESDDAVFNAEQRLVMARAALDRAGMARRTGQGDEVAQARAALKDAEAQLAQQRQTAAGLRPDGTSDVETALNVARAQLLAAQGALDQTRIRAAVAGTVLQVAAKLGEVATPAEPLIIIGDLTALRVRAEVEERDVASIRANARVVVRADAFPDQEFEGEVASIAPALAPSRLSPRGPRRPSDVEALEVLITLAGKAPLRPGMRVDVYFYPEQTEQRAENR